MSLCWFRGRGPFSMFFKLWRIFASLAIFALMFMWSQDLRSQHLLSSMNVGMFRQVPITRINTTINHQLPLSRTNATINQQLPLSRMDVCDNEEVTPCESIHVAIVCTGYSSSRSVGTLIKSILFYRRHPIVFHFITDSIATSILKQLTDTWSIPQVEFNFYDMNPILPELTWVPLSKHYSGVFSLLKLTLVSILPRDLNKVIVLDTDVTTVSDISKLWHIFNFFSSSQVVALVENQSNWYIKGKIIDEPWPALGRGYNTGVMLMDLNGLRKINWMSIWKKVAKETLKKRKRKMKKVVLPDQDIMNAILVKHSDLLYRLPCTWNIQFCRSCRSDILCYRNGSHDINIFHLNSKDKTSNSVNHFINKKHIKFGKSLYFTFLQFDGNLLRRELYTCNKTNVVENILESDKSKIRDASGNISESDKNKTSDAVENISVSDKNNKCFEFRKIVYRTHIYYLDYSKPEHDDYGITFVAQLSMDRLHIIETLCRHWIGPISLALYLSDSEASQFTDFVLGSEVMKLRNNIGYHVVYKEGSSYPVNYLRNVALNNLNTQFVLLCDIDFLPSYGIYESLQKSVKNHFSTPNSKTVLVVPAFETLKYKMPNFPDTKEKLVKMLDSSDIFSFRFDTWIPGHAPTDFSKWRTATKPYTIKWKPYFEPYIVARSNVARYDTRFTGFGWNKISHIMEVASNGTTFVVLPDTFLIHFAHAPSVDLNKFRSSSQYRKCVDILKKSFDKDLQKKYGALYIRLAKAQGIHPRNLLGD